VQTKAPLLARRLTPVDARGPGWYATHVGTGRQALVAVVTALLAVLAPVSCEHRSPVPTPRYNLLFISLDTARQDVLGCYGHRPLHAPHVPTSPSLDRLAREGIRMLDAYTSAPWTLPAHVSMMTGQPTLVHGVETHFQTLDASRPVLAEILKGTGYRTAGVFSGPYLEPHWGFGRGFERYRARYGPAVVEASRRAAEARGRPSGGDAGPSQAELDAELLALSDQDVNSDQVTAGVLEDMDEFARGAQPWFIFAHYFDPHYDYVPPPPYATRFDPTYDGTISGVDFLTNPRIAVLDEQQPDAWIRRASERDLEHIVALYEGEIAWVDAHVGTLLERLDTLGLADKTLVVVVGDHGDEFFEHGGIGHHRTLYDESVKVPMLLRLPGRLPADEAVRGAVSVDDLLPTVLDVLGLPAARGLVSTSFLPLVRGERTAAASRAFARLVRVREINATIDARVTVGLRQLTVLETFRQGPIKITRRRSWPQVPSDVPADLRPILQHEADAQFQHEDIRWIDVERFPAEREADQSTDFSGPTARAALAAFRARYAEMLARHTNAPTAAFPDGLLARLKGLGYVDTSPSSVGAGGIDTPLPLPGAGIVD
jgi:arylsulfatase A-like enzyme